MYIVHHHYPTKSSDVVSVSLPTLVLNQRIDSILLVLQILFVRKSPRSEKEVLEGEKECRRQAKIPHVNKARSKVWISSSKNVGGGQNQGLAAAEPSHHVIGINPKFQRASLGNGLVDPAVQLSKSGLRSDTHPNYKVFVGDSFNWTDNIWIRLVEILRVVVLWIIVTVAYCFIRWVNKRIFTSRVRSIAAASVTQAWAYGIVETVRLCKHEFDIARPSDPFFNHVQGRSSHITPLCEGEVIVEECICRQATRVDSDISDCIHNTAIFFTEIILVADLTQQLFGIPTRKVITVILVEIGEFVVDKYRRGHVFWDIKLQKAGAVGVEGIVDSTDRSRLVKVVVLDSDLNDILFQLLNLVTCNV